MSSSSGAQRSLVMTAASWIDPSALHATQLDTNTFSLFFYGTLVHPAILSRVIGDAGHHLIVQPAVLPGHALHRVRNEEYPGLVTLEQSRTVVDATNSEGGEDAVVAGGTTTAISAVRGTVVHGLRAEEVRRLDAFEGDEYIRTAVTVLPDDAVPALRNDQRADDQNLAQVLAPLTDERIKVILARPPTAQSCHVYRWRASTARLEPRIWSFETFVSSGNHQKWWRDGHNG